MQPLDHDYLRTESSVFSVLIADGLSSLVSLEYLDLRVRNYLPLMPKDEVIFSSHSSAVSWISQDNQISDLSEIAKLAPVSGCLSGAGETRTLICVHGQRDLIISYFLSLQCSKLLTLMLRDYESNLTNPGGSRAPPSHPILHPLRPFNLGRTR